MSLEDQKFSQTDKLIADLASDPSTRPAFLRMVKQKNPDLIIPELEQEERLAKLKEEMTAENQRLAQQIRDRDTLDELNKRRADVVRSGLISEDELPEVEKLMQDGHATSHEAAAKMFAYDKLSRVQPAATEPMTRQRAFVGADLKEWMADPDGTALKTAEQALREFRGLPAAGMRR